MNVFIIGSAFDTALILDKKRLNKQIVECGQILKAIIGETKAWANHPCTIQYKAHKEWLYDYMLCLELYRLGDFNLSQYYSLECEKKKPSFHTEAFFNQMKRRLYTKNNDYYKQWSHLGESEVNWYYPNGVWKYYKNGKEIKYE